MHLPCLIIHYRNHFNIPSIPKLSSSDVANQSNSTNSVVALCDVVNHYVGYKSIKFNKFSCCTLWCCKLVKFSIFNYYTLWCYKSWHWLQMNHILQIQLLYFVMLQIMKLTINHSNSANLVVTLQISQIWLLYFVNQSNLIVVLCDVANQSHLVISTVTLYINQFFFLNT